MTTLLQEFEEWLRLEYEQTGDGDWNEAIGNAMDKLEELKDKYNVEKWTMPEEAFRWLAFQHEYNALKEKYKVGKND